MHTFWVLYTCSYWLKTRVTNIVRGGSTCHNIKKDSYTWVRKRVPSATCSSTLVHRRCSIWRPFMILVIGGAQTWRPSIVIRPSVLRQQLWPYSICFLDVYLVSHGGGLTTKRRQPLWTSVHMGLSSVSIRTLLTVLNYRTSNDPLYERFEMNFLLWIYSPLY